MSVDNLLDAEELKATAAKTLDQDDDTIPEFYLPLLAAHLQKCPHDTNFIVELANEKKPGAGGNGFGTVTCMEDHCWQDIILDADPNRPEGGKSDGLGSFFNYQVYCLEEDHKKGRDARLAKQGIKTTTFARPSSQIAPSQSVFSSVAPHDGNALASSSKLNIKAEPASKSSTSSAPYIGSKPTIPFRSINGNLPQVKSEFKASSSQNRYRSQNAGFSSDPIYISSGDEESDDDDVVEITGNQIPLELRKITNEDDPFAIDSDNDEEPPRYASSLRDHSGPSLYARLTQPMTRQLDPVPSDIPSTSASAMPAPAAGNFTPGNLMSILPANTATGTRKFIELIASCLRTCPSGWWKNEVCIAINQQAQTTGGSKTLPVDTSRPRVVDAVTSSPMGSVMCILERNLMEKLWRQHSGDEERRDALWTRIRTLAQCIGPGGARYETPSLLVMALSGRELSTLWETYISKYDAPGTALSADRKPVGSGAGQHAVPFYSAPRAFAENAVAGPSSRPVPDDTKPFIEHESLSAAWRAQQAIMGMAGIPERLANWAGELQGTYGQVAAGIAGAVGLAGEGDPFAEPNWGTEWDRPGNAALSDFFKTALDDFQEDIDVEKALEGLGLDRLESKIEGMNVQLMPHQVIGVHWMVEQERKNSCQGGILGDAMGLGKTVQAIATMVKNPSTDRKIRTTLIVVPLPLLHQWKSEIETKSHLTAMIYHGQGRTKSLNQLRNIDCVITTYSILVSEGAALLENHKPRKKKQKDGDFIEDDEDNKPSIKKKGLLYKMAFYRIILDESATIRNKATKASKCIHELISNIRWCLTGTLIYNSLDDIYPALRFVGVIDWEDFRIKVHSIAKSKPRLACRRSQAILRKVMLRRTKDSELHGKKILQLPPKTTDMIELEFTEEERAIYAAIETAARVKVNRWFKAGTLLKQYHVVLVMLTRLRQLCCHPWLLRASNEYRDGCIELEENVEEGDAAPNLESLSDEAEIARAEKALGPVWVDDVRKKLEERYASMVAENDDVDGNDYSCAICFEPYTNELVTACKHSFCAQCIDGILTAPPRGEYDEEQLALLARHARPCPMCRAEVNRASLYRASAFFDPAALEEQFDAGEGEEADEDIEVEEGSFKGKKRAPDQDGPNAKRLKGKGKAKVEEPDEAENDLDNVDIEDVLPSTKMKRVGDLLDMWHEIDPTQKTLIFCSFVEMLELMSVYLRKRGIDHVRYNGRMKMAEREEAIRKFKETGDKSPTVMLISLKCGGVGLNLTVANNVIGLDLAWSPASEAQAVDRAHRIGQTRAVSVKRLIVKNSVEERILALQQNKQALADGAMGEGEGGRLGRLSAGELVRLFGSDNE